MRAVQRQFLKLHQGLFERFTTSKSLSCLSRVCDAVSHDKRSFGSGAHSENQKQHHSLLPKHWLDRRLPGLRQWLQAKNRQWWLKGMQVWYRKYPTLQGSEQQLEALIEQTYQQFHIKHHSRVSDERSETHLQVACLVLATYKILLPYIKNHEELADIIRAHMGEQISPALRFLLRSTLYLSPNPYKTMANRLKGLQQDYGRGFDTEYTGAAQYAHSSSALAFYCNLYTWCFVGSHLCKLGLVSIMMCLLLKVFHNWRFVAAAPRTEFGLTMRKVEALCSVGSHALQKAVPSVALPFRRANGS